MIFETLIVRDSVSSHRSTFENLRGVWKYLRTQFHNGVHDYYFFCLHVIIMNYQFEKDYFKIMYVYEVAYSTHSIGLSHIQSFQFSREIYSSNSVRLERINKSIIIME